MVNDNVFCVLSNHSGNVIDVGVPQELNIYQVSSCTVNWTSSQYQHVPLSHPDTVIAAELNGSIKKWKYHRCLS